MSEYCYAMTNLLGNIADPDFALSCWNLSLNTSRSKTKTVASHHISIITIIIIIIIIISKLSAEKNIHSQILSLNRIHKSFGWKIRVIWLQSMSHLVEEHDTSGRKILRFTYPLVENIKIASWPLRFVRFP